MEDNIALSRHVLEAYARVRQAEDRVLRTEVELFQLKDSMDAVMKKRVKMYQQVGPLKTARLVVEVPEEEEDPEEEPKEDSEQGSEPSVTSPTL